MSNASDTNCGGGGEGRGGGGGGGGGGLQGKQLENMNSQYCNNIPAPPRKKAMPSLLGGGSRDRATVTASTAFCR